MQIVERTTISDCLISGQVPAEASSVPLDHLPDRVTFEGKCENDTHGDGKMFSTVDAEARLYEDGYLFAQGEAFSATNELFHSILLALDGIGSVPEEDMCDSPVVSSFVLSLGSEKAIKESARVQNVDSDAARGVHHYTFEREDGSTISLKQGLLAPDSVLVEPNEPVDEAAALLSDLMAAL